MKAKVIKRVITEQSWVPRKTQTAVWGRLWLTRQRPSNLLMWTLLLFKRGHISASSKDVSHQDLLAEGQRWPKILQIRFICLQVVSASNTPSIKWEACLALFPELMWSVWLNKSWFDSWITSYVGWHSLTFWLRTLLRVKEPCGWVHLLNVSGVKWHSANIAPAAFCHIICSKWLQLLRTRVTNSEQYVSRTAAEHSGYLLQDALGENQTDAQV